MSTLRATWNLSVIFVSSGKVWSYVVTFIVFLKIERMFEFGLRDMPENYNYALYHVFIIRYTYLEQGVLKANTMSWYTDVGYSTHIHVQY